LKKVCGYGDNVSDESYALDPKFEAVVAAYTAINRKFYGQLGHALNAGGFKRAVHKLVVSAAKEIAKDTGHGPGDQSIVMQRIRRWHNDGKVTLDELDDVIDFFVDFDVGKAPSVPDVIAEMTPVVQEKLRRTIVRRAIDSQSKGGDLSDVEKLIKSAARVGKRDTNVGMRLGVQSISQIASMRFIDKLKLGIPELDIALQGGLPRGCQLIYVGGTGAGKSMGLAHTTAHAVEQGYNALVATLEVSEAVWQARVIANMTGVAIDDIIAGKNVQATETLLSNMFPLLGNLVVKSFPAKIATMVDIREWVRECCEADALSYDVLVVDYGDKLASHDHKDKDTYSAQGTVFEDMRLFGEELNMWTLTASQAKRKGDKAKDRLLDIDDGADSQNKARVADMVITLNPHGDGDQINYRVVKNRHGLSGMTVGPIPHDWPFGRMVIR
jgi:KaiC/GvpD/RAD55 family RecA-like ATPase